MNKRKINWIENLRALAILSVVLGHISNPTQSFIFTWHMPLFFIISGFFIDVSKGEAEFFISTFKRLIPLYFIAMLAGFVAEYSKNIILDRDQISLVSRVWLASIWMDYSALKNSYGFVLWFLPALFWARCILFLLIKRVKSNFIILLVIFFWIVFSPYVELPFALDEGLFALPFVFVGSYIYRNISKVSQKAIVILLASIIMLYVLSLYFKGLPNIDLARKLISPYFIGGVQAIFVCVALVNIFFLMPFQSRIVTKISSLSLPIFILHPYTNNIAHLFVDNFLPGNWILKFLISLIGVFLLHKIWGFLARQLTIQ